MLTQFELILALSQKGYLRGTWALPKDAQYSPVSPAFIHEALEAWVAGLPSELVLLRDIGGGKTVRFVRWEAESGDCDNIAFDFLAYLSRCMWVDAIKTRTPRGNVAAGAFYFQRTPGDPLTGHSIVWYIDQFGAAHCVDTGSKEFDHLSAAQIATIYGGEYA